MIARTWEGRASAGSAPGYLAHLKRDVIPELESVPGFRGITVLQRAEDGAVRFTIMTWWDSMDVIGAFAGEDLERAVVAPEARALLSAFDDSVRHHEVAIDRRELG